MAKQRTPAKVKVREVLANGDERREVRWPPGADPIDSPVKDWRHVRNIDFRIDPSPKRACFRSHGTTPVRESSGELGDFWNCGNE